MTKIKFNSGHLILIIFILMLIFIQLRSYNLENQIKKSNNFIIAKFESKVRFPKTTDFNFGYYINGKKYITANSGINYSILNSSLETKLIDSLTINCFYLAKLNIKYPKVIIVYPNKQITDTATILKAGFTKDDFKKKIALPIWAQAY